MTKKLIGFKYPSNVKEEMKIVEVEIQKEVRVAFCGAWLSREDAENYREDFFVEFGQDIKDGNLSVIQDEIVLINAHWVVRILAENSQMVLPLDFE